MIRRLIETAQSEARERGGELRAVHIRLGALAGGSPEHIKEHFLIEARALGLDNIALHISEAPDHPAGVEITGLEVTEPL
jgi:hypothetical protein